MKPLISLVIPFYNRASFLYNTLQSVVRQDYRPLQVILVDNGSKDDSLGIVQDFKKNNEVGDFQVIILHEFQRGAASARNCGLDACLGEYTYFFDSDDEMSPDFLSLCQTEAEQNSLDLVAAPARMQFANGKTLVRNYCTSSNPVDQIPTGALSTQSMFFRTSFIRSIRWNSDVLIWNDWELGIRVMLARPKMKWLHRAFHLIRQHSESISGEALLSSRIKIENALCQASSDIKGVQPISLRRKCIAALACRISIVEGRLQHEGLAGFPDLMKQAFLHFGKARHPIFFCFLRFLRFYTCHGGRGAWRFARFFCVFIK